MKKKISNTNNQEPSLWYELIAIGDEYSDVIDQEIYVIGRAAELKDHFKDKIYVSRQHAKLTITTDGISIEDLSVSGITCVNNEVISTTEPTLLMDGDEIGLGGWKVDGKRQKEAAYFLFRGPFQK